MKNVYKNKHYKIVKLIQMETGKVARGKRIYRTKENK